MLDETIEDLRAQAADLLAVADELEKKARKGATMFYIDRASSFSEQPCDEATPCGDSLWEIALTSLADLCELVEREGEIIIGPIDGPMMRGHDRYRLTIYDDDLEPIDAQPQ